MGYYSPHALQRGRVRIDPGTNFKVFIGLLDLGRGRFFFLVLPPDLRWDPFQLGPSDMGTFCKYFHENIRTWLGDRGFPPSAPRVKPVPTEHPFSRRTAPFLTHPLTTHKFWQLFSPVYRLFTTTMHYRKMWLTEAGAWCPSWCFNVNLLKENPNCCSWITQLNRT